MQKIPTLFLRYPDDRAHVTREVNPECQWVIDGEGVATRKYDGTCVMFDGKRWWARREVKPGKQAPPNFQPIVTDEATGKAMGWEPIEQSAFAKFHAEALSRPHGRQLPPGTYELIGPKINGNPEDVRWHLLLRHEDAWQWENAPRDFDGLRNWLLTSPDEGIVWHHPDGRMAKLKRKDFA